MRKLLLLAVAGLALATAAPALAANPTTSGSATITDNVGTIVSNTAVPNTPADDGGAITFPIASGLTLAQITQLSADFNVTDDDCSAGSPRFAINFGLNKNVLVYLDRRRRSHVAARQTPGSRPATSSARATPVASTPRRSRPARSAPRPGLRRSR